jgi:DNA-binding transcriptional LysR family regulator
MHSTMCEDAPMDWDWDGLRIFLAVVRAGRASTAARALGIEHTTVSRRLAALEEQLGARLFYRTARGYLLTPQGEAIVRDAETAERAAGAVRDRVHQASAAPARVRVATLPELGTHWLAPLLPAFRARRPGIELEVLVDPRSVDLARGEADLAVRTPRPRQVGLSARRLFSLQTGLYASRALLGGRRLRVTDPASTRGLALVVYSAAYQPLQSAAWFQPVLVAGPIAVVSNATHVNLAAALSGVGARRAPAVHRGSPRCARRGL